MIGEIKGSEMQIFFYCLLALLQKVLQQEEVKTINWNEICLYL